LPVQKEESAAWTGAPVTSAEAMVNAPRYFKIHLVPVQHVDHDAKDHEGGAHLPCGVDELPALLNDRRFVSDRSRVLAPWDGTSYP
jgi:hypothetical protein